MRLSALLKQISKVEDHGSLRSPVLSGAAELQAGLYEAVQSGKLAPRLTFDLTSAARWIGFIDRVAPDAVHGWAYDKQNPDASVTVEAVTDTGKRSLALANLVRDDVANAGHGTGRYGFVLDLARLALKDETIIVRFADSKYPISHEPIDFDAQRALLSQEMPLAFFESMFLLAARIRIAAEISEAPNAARVG